jgi:hypothetical protein
MAAGVDKVIVTNLSALKQKYGSGLAKIQAAVKQLIEADKGRGLKTVLVALDDAAAVKKLKAKAVADAANEKQNKAAIDGVFRALTPDYVLILGSVDVIPHQGLVNPAHDPSSNGDPDEIVPGDLPYACEAPYSTAISDFTGPTRVVGRLPDLTGGRDPDYLVGLLGTAANYRSLTFQDYAGYLGISADVWRVSTELSLQAVFGSSADLKVSPPDGPDGKWPADLLGRRSHFINCHGAQADYRFYGQPDHRDEYPVAHTATWLPGRITEGTIVAAECCYGAELYDPSGAGGQVGICNTYLAEKAYGYFGSSTIAYGPEDKNDSADLMCQYYWKHVLEGASSGRAALQARQDFVQARSPLDPYNTKTLGQYNLMGDPSIHAVLTAPAARALAAAPARPGKARPVLVPALMAGPDPWGGNRALRRERLRDFGLAIGEAARVARRVTAPVPPRVKRALGDLAREVGAEAAWFGSFATGPRPGRRPRAAGRAKTARTAAEAPVTFHVASAALPRPHAPARARQLLVLIATEVDDTLLLRRLTSR